MHHHFWLLVIGLCGPASSLAEDLVHYALLRGESYRQTASPTLERVPETPFSFRGFAVADEPFSIFVELKLPSGSTAPLWSESGTYFALRNNFASRDALGAAFPDGVYVFDVKRRRSLSQTTVAMSLGPLALPPSPPELSNYSAAQAIDPAREFTLTWFPISGATPGDFIVLAVLDDVGTVIGTTPDVGWPGVIKGTETSVTMPAGSLKPGRTYILRLLYAKADLVDTDRYPRAIGVIASFKETLTTLKTTGTVVDTTPPRLVSVSPSGSLTHTPNDSPVQFTFNEAMAQGYAINWSAQIDTRKLTFVWSADHRTLSVFYRGGFPVTNDPITWGLNPFPGVINTSTDGSYFMDLRGHKLASTFGSFRMVLRPRFDAITRATDGSIRLRISAQPQVSHFLQGSTDLIHWSDLFQTNSSTGVFDYVYFPEPTQPLRFFRAGRY